MENFGIRGAALLLAFMICFGQLNWINCVINL